jgi:group I intron endonuclease
MPISILNAGHGSSDPGAVANGVQESNMGIYQIINIINNKKYIGSSVNLDKRKKDHFSYLKRGKHKNSHLQFAYNKYGEENFIFEIIEYVMNLDILLEREQYYIDSLKVCDDKFGYNLCPTAGSSYGIKFSKQTRKKMSDAHIGIAKGQKRSEEAKQKMSESKKGDKNPMYGKKASQKQKEVTSLRARGENNNLAKINNEIALRIKIMLHEGYKVKKIAKLFKLHRNTIYAIKNNIIWKHINLEDNLQELSSFI